MPFSDVDVLVIGGGVVGAALARELSRYTARTVLLEKEVDVSFGTSKANSGIIHSGIHDRPGSLKARLCIAGNRMYPQLAQELNVLYKQNGALVVAQEPGDVASLEALRHAGKSSGVPNITPLNRDELLRLEPALSPSLLGGLHIPSGGIVIPFDLVFALIENARANGVTVMLQTRVEQILAEGDEFIVRTNRGNIKAAYVINAAGLHAAQVARLAGDESFEIRPRKGEEYLLDRKLEGLVQRTIFPLPSAVSKGILVIPTVEGNLMLGPTAHSVGSFSDLDTTAAGWEEIFAYVRRLVPALRPGDLITSFAGLRAASGGEDFIIRRSARSSRFIHAAGIESPGLTAAPAIAGHIIELLRDSGLRLEPNPRFNPNRAVIRLRDLGLEERAKLMARDPAYARIVCRCETVSEGEIRDAIRRGATTLDGVKLRTRSGMGRCQGGFCTPRIIEILSQELGLAPEQITKRGGESRLLTGWLRGREEGEAHARDIR